MYFFTQNDGGLLPLLPEGFLLGRRPTLPAAAVVAAAAADLAVVSGQIVQSHRRRRCRCRHLDLLLLLLIWQPKMMLVLVVLQMVLLEQERRGRGRGCCASLVLVGIERRFKRQFSGEEK